MKTPLAVQSPVHLLSGDGKITDPDTDRILDRVGDRRRSLSILVLADALDPIRSHANRGLQQHRVQLRYVGGCRYLVVS